MGGELEILIARGRRSRTRMSSTFSPVRGFTSGGKSIRGVGVGSCVGVGVGAVVGVGVGGGDGDGTRGAVSRGGEVGGNVAVGVGVSLPLQPPRPSATPRSKAITPLIAIAGCRRCAMGIGLSLRARNWTRTCPKSTERDQKPLG
ncbi:MAG: hypothetical protein D6759_03830 [Chloroflexi bacterium]|nr:MAG: hypothetical protein D6759_03830 [Chloroflexota bacterium]